MQLRLPTLRSPCLALPAVAQRRHTRLVVLGSAAHADHSVGIDLGTTNSAVAVVEAGVPRIIPTVDGRTTPSIVSLGPEGEVLVGAAAKRVAAQQPHTTFYSTKRLIGRRIKDVKRSAPKLAYSVDGDVEGAVVLECSAAPTGRLRPEEVSAHVLRHLLAAAEADLGAHIRRAVISVPAYFDPAQRDATVAAGKLAGLDKVRLIREPVAAALAYGLDLQQEATVLVADLGGGTFDVALLEVGGGTAEVLSTGGDAHLGGDDWDAAIAQHINDKHLKPAGIRVRSPQTWARLRGIAESAKVALSIQEKVLLRIPLQQPPLEALLTRQQLDGLTVPLFKRALVPLEDACRQAGVDLQVALARAEAARQRGGGGGRRPTKRAAARAPLDVQLRPKQRPPISEVLLVGGATRMPSFRRFISNVTGLEPRPSAVDPDEAVALGASIQAAMLEGQLSDFMVLDVWQASLMRAFAGKAAPEQIVEAGTAAELAALAAELGVAVEDISEEDLAGAEAEFQDLSEGEIDALLATGRGDQ